MAIAMVQGRVEFLFKIFIAILFFKFGYTIVEVNYLRGVPRLGNTSYWDYYFSCNTEGQTLQWEVNGDALGGFLTGEVARVFSSMRSNFDYIATLLSSRPVSGMQYSFDSILIVSLMDFAPLDITCRNGTLSNSTNNTESKTEVLNMNMTDFVNLQYLVATQTVRMDNSTTSIFLCGVNNNYLVWESDTIFYALTSIDSFGQGRQVLLEDKSTVKTQAILLSREPYQLVSLLFVNSTLATSVQCGYSENTLEFPITTNFMDTTTNNNLNKNPTISTTNMNVDTNSSFSITTTSKAETNLNLVPIIVLCGVVVVVLVTLGAFIFILVCKCLSKRRVPDKGKTDTKPTLELHQINQQNKREEDKSPTDTPEEDDTKDVKYSISQEKKEANQISLVQMDLPELLDEEDIKQEHEMRDELYEEYLKSIEVEVFAKWKWDKNRKRDIYYEYEFLRKVTERNDSCCEGKKYKKKNRNAKVIPYDSSRVKLMPIQGVEGSDYINASFVDGHKQSNAYIAAQTPMPNTICDFWRMIFEQNATTIVMFREVNEAKMNHVQYWPKNVGEMQPIENTDLQVTYIMLDCFADYEIRSFEVQNGKHKKINVKHYLFLSWPDSGIPKFVTPFIQFLYHIKSNYKHQPKKNNSIVVHSKIGTGRAGVFIALDAMTKQMEAEKTIGIFKFVQDMRFKRRYMVRTRDQYRFIYKALREICICGDTSVEAHKLRDKIKELDQINSDTEKNKFLDQFRLLRKISPQLKKDRRSDAIEHNTSGTSFPYSAPCEIDSGRLDSSGNFSETEYFSVVDGYRQRECYIGTSVPLKDSMLNDFWSMIWEKQSQAIVLLGDLREEILYKYWAEQNETKVHNKIEVKMETVQQSEGYVERNIHVANKATDENRTVTLYYFGNWPENDSPSETSGILHLIFQLEANKQAFHSKHLVVMCSDGVGRTGAFMTIHGMIEKVNTENIVDFFQFLMLLRIGRPGLVKELEHYKFCHDVLADYIEVKQGKRTINAD